uniref:C-type lectin domain-containing protein n=1 Tax=Panagrellus redivivus TaxID=6233 RepID=A0A7E4VRE6_PANRE
MTSVRITALLILVIVGLASSDYVPSKYPGLTLAQARCPEEPWDPYWWFIAEHDKIPLCFGRYPLPSKLNSAEDLATACRKKHKDAEPVEAIADKYYAWFRDFEIFGLIGKNGSLYYMNEYGNTRVTLPIEASNYYVVCVTQAYPRVLSSYNLPIEPTPNLSLYTCEGNGWEMLAPCGGTPFCYKLAALYASSPYTESKEFNLCGVILPNSFPVSLHCEAEANYALWQTKYPIHFGYQLPRLSLWNKFDSWHNVDGTPADYAPWTDPEPNNYEGHHESFGISDDHVFRDISLYEWYKNFVYTLCKKPGVY